MSALFPARVPLPAPPDAAGFLTGQNQGLRDAEPGEPPRAHGLGPVPRAGPGDAPVPDMTRGAIPCVSGQNQGPWAADPGEPPVALRSRPAAEVRPRLTPPSSRVLPDTRACSSIDAWTPMPREEPTAARQSR